MKTINILKILMWSNLAVGAFFTWFLEVWWKWFIYLPWFLTWLFYMTFKEEKSK